MAQSCAPVFPSQEAKGSITPLQRGSQWTVRRPPSTEEDEMTHSAVSFISITAKHAKGTAAEEGEDGCSAQIKSADIYPKACLWLEEKKVKVFSMDS